jgi:hypothetical protein
MPLPLSFELRLEERCANRVVVSVLLAPDGGPAVRIEGIALHLQSRTGEPLGVQMVLPIAGDLRHPMLSTVELKLDGDIPQGSRVVGTAWQGVEQREASVPTDPFTELEAHMWARRRISLPGEGLDLEPVLPEERELLATDFPWINAPLLPPDTPLLTVVDSEDPADSTIDEVVDELGIDAESASWLKDLLKEDPIQE